MATATLHASVVFMHTCVVKVNRTVGFIVLALLTSNKLQQESIDH